MLLGPLLASSLSCHLAPFQCWSPFRATPSPTDLTICLASSPRRAHCAVRPPPHVELIVPSDTLLMSSSPCCAAPSPYQPHHAIQPTPRTGSLSMWPPPHTELTMLSGPLSASSLPCCEAPTSCHARHAVRPPPHTKLIMSCGPSPCRTCRAI